MEGRKAGREEADENEEQKGLLTTKFCASFQEGKKEQKRKP